MQKEKKSSKSNSVRTIPEGFHTVTPYLVANDAPRLIEFMVNAFDGKVTFITKDDNGRVVHATVKIGDSIIMVSDTMEDMRPEPAMLFLYVDDVDSIYRQAIDADGSSIQKPRDEFYGDRAGAVKDEWGNKWWIATHIEDVDPKELEKRSKESQKEREQVH